MTVWQFLEMLAARIVRKGFSKALPAARLTIDH